MLQFSVQLQQAPLPSNDESATAERASILWDVEGLEQTSVNMALLKKTAVICSVADTVRLRPVFMEGGGFTF